MRVWLPGLKSPLFVQLSTILSILNSLCINGRKSQRRNCDFGVFKQRFFPNCFPKGKKKKEQQPISSILVPGWTQLSNELQEAKSSWQHDQAVKAGIRNSAELYSCLWQGSPSDKHKVTSLKSKKSSSPGACLVAAAALAGAGSRSTGICLITLQGFQPALQGL